MSISAPQGPLAIQGLAKWLLEASFLDSVNESLVHVMGPDCAIRGASRSVGPAKS